MIHFTCDMCGKRLEQGADTRYVIKIEVYAAYDPLEISEEDLETDHTEEIEDLLDEIETRETEELEDEVYKAFRFDLCPECHAAYLKDPLGRGARLRVRFERN